MGVARIFFWGGTLFKKIFKKFSMNFQKIFKNLFKKYSKNFRKKIAGKGIILAYFQKHLTNHALIFCAVGRKRQFIGNFEKIFDNFENFPSENC